jgi:hypothetical protein
MNNHGLAAVEDHAVLQMRIARVSTRRSISRPLAGEILGRVAVADAFDIPVDDRAFIEVPRDVMRGRADQLDSAFMRLVVGPRGP